MLNNVQQEFSYHGVALSELSIEALRDAESKTIEAILEHQDRLDNENRLICSPIPSIAKTLVKDEELLIAIQDQIQFRYSTTLV